MKGGLSMDDLSIIELFRKRDEKAIAELKEKYERIKRHLRGYSVEFAGLSLDDM